MPHQLYQRQHQRSHQAASKPYRFLKLPLVIDTAPLETELTAIDPPWLPSQWKWHLGTYFCILRAGPPGPWVGAEMVTGGGIDAPILQRLPAFRQVLDTALPVPVPLAWIGLSPPQSCIHLHIDNTPHWDEHHRLHIPLVTNPQARLCCEGHFLHLSQGSVWVLNNSRPHGACNGGGARLHLILDLPSTPAVEALLVTGEPRCGEHDPETLARLAADPLQQLTLEAAADPDLMARLRQQ